MSKKSNIRWRESDTKEIERAVRNFNAKIYRLRKKHPENVEFYPQTIKLSDAVESVQTRGDFVTLTNSLKRFSQRGAETIEKSNRSAHMTTWAKEEYKRKQKRENQQKARERKRLGEKEVKIGGKGTGKTRAEMGTIKQNELKPSKKKPENMSQKEWEKATSSIDKRLNENYKKEKLELMRENYIKGLTDAGFLGSDENIEKFIRGVSLEKFYETVEIDETATFQFYKDPIAWNTRLQYIRDSWEIAYSEYQEGLKK